VATSLEIIEGALKHLGVNPAESPVTAAEAQDGLDDLNDMGSEWESTLQIGFLPAEDVNDEISLPRQAYAAFKAGLAGRIAPQYGKPIYPELAELMRETKKALDKFSLQKLTSEFPDTLPVGSGNECSNYGQRFYSNDGDTNF